MNVWRHVCGIAGIVHFCAAVAFGASSPSEWDSSCRKCHVERPVDSLYDSSTKAHSEASLSCVACHPNKGIAGHLKRSAERFRLLFRNMTLPPDVRPQNPASFSSDDCLACHPHIQDVDEIPMGKLPAAVRSIKLRAAHGRHWDYRARTSEQQEKLKALRVKEAQSSLAKDDQAEIERLSMIEEMQCSRCHERFKKDRFGDADSNVNIAMKNPMECTACHIALRNSIHPGDDPLFPSAVACERCHHGALHQKMTFFPVDRAADEDCLRCHPGYERDELAAVKPDSFNHRSTGTIRKTAAGGGIVQ